MCLEFKKFIDVAIKLELNASELYGLFSRTFAEDKRFWHKLAEEENSHALLLMGAKDLLAPSECFPSKILAQDVAELLEHNLQLEKTIARFKTNLPSKEHAVQTALKLELSAGEIHYQKAMMKTSPFGIFKIFQELNANDKDHAERIQKYATAHNIAIPEDS